MKGLAAAMILAATGTVAAEPAAVARARALLQGPGAAIGIAAADGFRARAVLVDADGSEHVRFDRTWAGLPVIGGDVVTHVRAGRLLSASATVRAPLDLVTVPTLDRADAIVAAGVEFGSDFAGTPTATLAIYARGAKPPRLVWQVQLRNEAADATFFVDAADGRIVDHWSNRQEAAVAGSGRSLYLGEVPLVTNSLASGFELRDPSRGGMYTLDASNSRYSGQVFKDTDNTWGDYTVADRITTAVDAQHGAALTWDYFLNVHGRRGIADDGRGAYSRVHYGTRYSNAYWNDGCFCMTYGDGDGVSLSPLVALDIAAHEMSHGVNARTANLFYSGESGGLNEANSDIFSAMVEFHANNAYDTPDYLVGEEVFMGNVAGSPDQRALRYMFNPIADGRSPNCYTATLGNLDVHYSSGVGNRFFYLLAEGSGARTYSGVNHAAATCNGKAVAGIGRDKAERIWYRALTVYMTSDTNYAAARDATIRAANDLFGVASEERKQVAAAWNAVRVY